MNKFYITTSWDDGALEDLKLAELLRKYEIPATFYIPIKNPERKVLNASQIKHLSKRFEIGGHTYSHFNLTKLSITEAEKEIVLGKRELENIIGKPVTSFAYPYGAYNDPVKQLVGLSGFSLARSVNYLSTSIDDKLATSTTVHAYNHHPLINIRNSLRLMNPYKLKYMFNKWDETALSLLEYCKSSGGVFHLWGHSWEIEKYGQWGKLEQLLKHIRITHHKATFVKNSGLIDHLQDDKYTYYSTLDPKVFERSYKTSYYVSETRFISSLIQDFDKPKFDIADVGCGIGRLSGLFEKAKYVGFDNSPNLINFLIKNKKGDFQLLDLDKFISSNRKWDLIVVLGLFEDFVDPITCVDRLLRKLKNRGRLVLTLSNSTNPIFRLSKILRAEYMYNPFPTTAFDREFITNRLTRKIGSNYDISSFTFGLIPPMMNQIPALRSGKYGVNEFFVIDKK